MKNKHLIYLLVIGFLSISCTGGSDQTDDGLFLFDDLNEISIELDMEIGEREGYIPGRIRNLILTTDGSIIVSDGDNVTLDLYSPDGTFVKTLATEGNGPGEIPQNFSIADMGMGQYLLRAGGNRRTYLSQTSDGEFEFGETFLAPPIPGRGRNLFVARSDSEYYGLASPPPVETHDEQNIITRQLVIANELGEILQDSLLEVQVASPVTITFSGMMIMTYSQALVSDEVMDPGRGDGSYIITRPREKALEVYSADHQLEKRVELQLQQQEFTSAELDTIVEQTFPSSWGSEVPQSSRTAFRDRVLEQGKPAFFDLWPSDDKYLLLTERLDEENQMVVISADGDPLGRFDLPTTDVVHYFRDDKIYTVHTDPARGYFVRVYDVNI